MLSGHAIYILHFYQDLYLSQEQNEKLRVGPPRGKQPTYSGGYTWSGNDTSRFLWLGAPSNDTHESYENELFHVDEFYSFEDGVLL